PTSPALSHANKVLAQPPKMPQIINWAIEGRTICKARRDPTNNHIPATWLLLKSCQKLMEGLKSIMELSMQCLPKVRDEVYAEWQFYQCYKLLYNTTMFKNAAIKPTVHVENKHQNDKHRPAIVAR